MSSWVGKRLGRVQIESLVGRGGVAEVYLGTHTSLERKVAVKILRNLNEEDTDALERFQREARVIAKFRHPNIVQVHDFDTVENDPYLVMEYIEGPSLSKYLNALHLNNQQLPLPHVIRLLDAMGSALQYAHKNGVVHRDIKPGNILLTSPSQPVEVGELLPEDFEPVLTDFGLVRFLDGSRQTTTGQIAGTPAYMSPEQARGEATDGRTDVYSLGIVLYEILAGHVPFDGETTVSILLKQVNDPPPPIPGLSPYVAMVLNRALAKDLKDRFQTPLEFTNAFRASIEMKTDPATLEMDSLQLDVPPLIAEQSPEAPPEQPPKQRPRWMPIALLAIVAAAIAGLLSINKFPSAPSETTTPTAPVSTTVAPPISTATGTEPPAPVAGPPGILRFQNGSAVADQAFLFTQAMPAPPAGSQYEIWLTNKTERISLGIFSPDEIGQGELSFSDPEGMNLISRYDRVEITIEPEPDTDPKASGLIAYSFTLPEEGLTHARYLLATFPNAPGGRGLIQGLSSDMKQIAELVHEMQDAFEGDDKVTALENAEDALNLLVGSKSADYKDWNADGQILPKSDSYGLLVNGNSFGYLQAVYAEADFTVNTPGATQYMIENGEVVKLCTQNLMQWTPQLRELLLTILTSTSDAEISEAMSEAVVLVDQMLHGIDLDEDGTVDAVARECGVETAYEYAYYMVDMPILPASISYQLTVVADYTPVIATNNNNSQNSAPTARPRATRKPKPTKKPKDSNHNNRQ